MATFSLKLDTRVHLKDDKFNLSVVMINGRDVMYLKIVPLTEKQYDAVFVKKAMDPKSVDFRNNCIQFLHKCESTFAEMKTFDKPLFRKLVYDKVKKEEVVEESLKLTDLCTKFLAKKVNMKQKTKNLYKTATNSFDDYQPGITILDITPEFLLKYEKAKQDEEYSPSSIAAYFRHIRGLINYFMYKEKVVTGDYVYPFGKTGYTISPERTAKFVMSNKEIKSVIDLKKFVSPEQEYARDIWVLLYRMNGMNYADLMNMKWTNIKNKFLTFRRMKTKNTRKIEKKDIVVPITPKVQALLNKVGDKNSPYILGLAKEGMSEEQFNNKKDWELQKLNSNLKVISEKLNLSVDLRVKTSRDCFATTHKRAGTPKEVIGEMMGHGNNYISTHHYMADLDPEQIWKANKRLL